MENGPDAVLTSSGMHELDRIEHALANRRLDPDLFERCATDILIETYQGLSPIPGGTDWGRDADIHGVDDGVPPRLMVTSSRSIDRVRANLVAGLTSLRDHGKSVERVVLANPALINEQQREKLRVKAREWDVTIEAFHDRGFFTSALRRDGAWRKALLGLSGEPISVSRVPSALAESPWASLPLVGRDAELTILKSTEKDVILTGPPGVGKTRLVADLTGSLFVNVDASDSERLTDDLRWLAPELLVVDDAGQHGKLVRQLVKLRSSESDLLKYRLICVCWPDELAALKDRLPGADVIDLPLLEREPMDRVIVSMGVRSQLARSEILDQADGRPGWAIALADILTKTKRWDSLFDGKALLGEVERYLRRAQLGTESVHVLAMIAALGGVNNNDLSKLATALNISVPTTVEALQSTAHSGVLDVSSTYNHSGQRVRTYGVRPPMLADALVAEHAFRAFVPALNLTDLASTWPAKLAQIAESAIDSALLGTADARPAAADLIRKYRSGNDGSSSRLGRLASRFACTDAEAGREVLSWALADFDQLRRSGGAEPRDLEGIVEIAELVARRYLVAEAVALLLDLAMVDGRPARRHPRHPVRELEDLVTDHHPELAPAKGLRQLVADTTDAWLARHDKNARAWEVYGSVAAGVLSLHRSGRYLDAADRRQVHMIESVVPSTEVEQVYKSVWPTIRSRLTSAPPLVVRVVIDAAADWLRIGGGHDRPFGIEHANTSVIAAKRWGAKLLKEFGSVVKAKPGLTVYLQRTAARYGLRLQLRTPNEFWPFFVDLDKTGGFSSALIHEREAVKATARPWANESPSTVIDRLVELRTQLNVARLEWPNRVEWACEGIAERSEDCAPWVEAALDGSLFPEAEPFLRAMLVAGGHVPEGLVERSIDEPTSRWRALGAVLSLDSHGGSVAYALHRIVPSDMPVLETLSFQRKLSIERQRELLTIPAAQVRGAAAFALARPVKDDADDWPPTEIESEWLEAIQLLDPSVTPQVEEYHLRTLFDFLKRRYPDTLVEYMDRRLQSMVDQELFSRQDELIQGLHLLPTEAKTRLMIKYGASGRRWFLLQYMPGVDIDWLREALDRNLMTLDEALKARDGFGPPEPSIPELAKLLVPRGMEPENVAAVAQYGVGWGEESDRAGKLVEEFQAYGDSEDESVAAVGRVGVEIYTRKRDTALQKEKAERVRREF